VMDDTGAPAVVAALDARMGEIYLGACRRGADGLARPVMDEQVLPPRLAAVPDGETWSGAGSGFATYREILSVVLEVEPGRVWSDALPRAGAVARLATAATAVDDPALALPVYLRDQVVRPAGRPPAP
jgi:tRNA threonylcarbamoyladenosine biosynthesis protein TsaB